MGDCLRHLGGLPASSIDLITLDPPFNTGQRQNRGQHPGYLDTWNWDADRVADRDALAEALGPTDPLIALIDAMRLHPRFQPGAGPYLAMLGRRLLECHRVLKASGSLYLHCDAHASHTVKIALDALFGSERFLNEIVWCYDTGGASPRRFARKHDTILFYTKSERYTFEWERIADERTPKSLHRAANPRGARYAAANRTKLPLDTWRIPALNPMATERCGYPTQKPLTLLERIILVSSQPGEIVLDPFCGSGTALVAAEMHGRNWIGIDASPDAIAVCQARLAALPPRSATASDAPRL